VYVLYEIGQAMELVGAKDDIHMGHALPDAFTLLLGHAACHGYN
jgi:hypothetical protein